MVGASAMNIAVLTISVAFFGLSAIVFAGSFFCRGFCAAVLDRADGDAPVALAFLLAWTFVFLVCAISQLNLKSKRRLRKRHAIPLKCIKMAAIVVMSIVDALLLILLPVSILFFVRSLYVFFV